MVLEFLSEADASSAFTFNDQSVFKRIREHPLFIDIEIHKCLNEKMIMVVYDSGLYEQRITRFVRVRRYKNYVRLIPEGHKHKWVAIELVDLFIPNKEYKILGD